MKYFIIVAGLGSINAQGVTSVERDTLFNPAEQGPEPTDPCCLSCTAPLEKYHSVDHVMNNCGEACMDPSKYWLYKLFEPGLEKSDTNTPCADRNYDDYKNTPTHGFGPIKMTLDLYGPHKEAHEAQESCGSHVASDKCDADANCSWCESFGDPPKCV